MRSLRLVLLFVGLLPLAGCAPDDRPRAAEAPIVGGARELGEEAVVFVNAVLGSCTGTLITDRVVLTAKHCVQDQGATVARPPSFFSVGVGNHRSSLVSHRVREVLTTPGPYSSVPTGGTDVALLILREPITGITPIPVRREPPDGLAGRDVVAIGFGQTPAGEVGTKYRTTIALETVGTWVLYARDAICQGDSGGPLLLESDGTRPREVIGIASYGEIAIGGEMCPASRDAWNRIDIQLDLVDRAILRSGGCAVRGAEECNSLDDDCNGEIDEGCAALGAACTADADCAFGPLPEALRDGAPPSVTCTDVGGALRCALPCDPLAPATSCAAMEIPFQDPRPLDGFYCAHTSACDGVCAPGAAGGGANGDACAADAECASLRCDAGLGVCSTPCLAGAGACPTGEVCAADAGSCAICASAASRPTGRALGEPCTDPAQCTSGGCGDVDGTSICTRACVNDLECGSGFHCEGGFCGRGDRSQLFETCRDEADCTSAACVDRGGARVCATRCTDAMSCVGSCEAVGEEMRCLPSAPVLGQACVDTCATGECLEGTCTALCGGDRACPIGYDCARDGGRTVCRVRAPRSTGCAVSPSRRSGDGSAGGIAIALALALVLVRRRRS